MATRSNVLAPLGLLVGALGLVTVMGCGGAPKPVDQLAAAQSAVRAAEENGAKEEPEATLHLKLAREQIEEAKVLIEDDDNDLANLVLLRAEADAELARALARKAALGQAAAKAVKDVQKLKTKGE